ncbi:MAG: leucine-rich repeat domain-containing protein, partial [Bacteroidales bacterium]
QNTHITEYPVELCNLENMRVLDIMGNKLTAIPQEIGNYKNMVQLRLCENGISELPDVFASLEKLDHLDLSGCQLKSFPESLTEARRLKSIFMEDCGLTHIPGVIGRAKQLHWVILSNNKISSVEPSVFATDAKLNTIFLSGNPISELPILPLPNLQMIAINNCQFTAVPDLSNYSKLIQFEMKNNRITSVPDNFLTGTALTKLILSENAELKTVPANLGVKMNGNVPATLIYADLRNCPKLSWTTPPSWIGTVIIDR